MMLVLFSFSLSFLFSLVSVGVIVVGSSVCFDEVVSVCSSLSLSSSVLSSIGRALLSLATASVSRGFLIEKHTGPEIEYYYVT